MKIGEIAERTGLSKDTIRYYEKKELLQPEIHNKQRSYNEEDIIKMETIVKLKQNGFSLLEIKMLFDWSQNMDKDKTLTKEEIEKTLLLKKMFQNKYNEMLKKEEQIKQIKQVLLRTDRKLEWLLDSNRKML
ncbi:MerR family transcriptional regulator [Psychrobacillus glaciei]|uniref:MerR family transcriptional regulator n=1 Tax=Psychrobacillus glaciei TaxID=2283160 RepID=A0A5J6SU20_9BACI|nr:MerR family transcriptional regulator [Psychrobacillus glaciei]QFG00485.1 MerR family transcriptional regulator [Psychrobacillus glaciei]